MNHKIETILEGLILDLKAMTEQEKDYFFCELFDKYCKYCFDYTAGRECYCWNDE